MIGSRQDDIIKLGTGLTRAQAADSVVLPGWVGASPAAPPCRRSSCPRHRSGIPGTAEFGGGAPVSGRYSTVSQLIQCLFRRDA